MKYSIEGETLTGIADAIREKGGADGTITVPEMADSIRDIGWALPESAATLVDVTIELPNGSIIYYMTYVNGRAAMKSCNVTTNKVWILSNVLKEGCVCIWLPRSITAMEIAGNYTKLIADGNLRLYAVKTPLTGGYVIRIV